MPRGCLTSMLLCALSLAQADDCCWCDPATPKSAQTIVDSEKLTHKLIFSDEFDTKGRNFANGHDTKWTALDIGDTSNQGAAFYLPSQAQIVTDTGPENNASLAFPPVSALRILTEKYSHVGDSPTGEKDIFMPFRSAMLQSWNKFCFTGGVVEFRARQPRGGGYWPALWLFGNLGRAVYQNSNTGLWPWSYSECDADLQLPPTDPPQRISACDDHDLELEGLNPFQGRGATELDVLEGAITNSGEASYVVGSLQLSPGIPPYFRPPMFGFPLKNNGGASEWYAGLTFGAPVDGLASGGFPNNGWYGPPWGADCPTGCPDALSGGFVGLNTLDTRYWTYKMEWKVGRDGHLSWWYDDAFVWGMSAESFGEYSVCTTRSGKQECWRTPPRMIPEEPMSIVMNTAIGTWNGGQTALDNKHWPASFYVDYVRVWQHEENVGCNPPDFPTKVYIDKNAELYGEPVSPVGYDTCPEKYPPKSHAKAAQLHQAAQVERAARVANGVPSHVTERAASATAFPGVLTSLASMAPAQAAHPTKAAQATAAVVEQQARAHGEAQAAAAAAGRSGIAAHTMNAFWQQQQQPPVPAAQSAEGPTGAVDAAAAPSSSVGLLFLVGAAVAGLLALGVVLRREPKAGLLPPWPQAEAGAYRAPAAADAEDELRSAYVAYSRPSFASS